MDTRTKRIRELEAVNEQLRCDALAMANAINLPGMAYTRGDTGSDKVVLLGRSVARRIVGLGIIRKSRKVAS